jgi:predicted RNA-binding protein YlxR (DUF448 family)
MKEAMVGKHTPLRTCVQCQQVRPKRELIRLVRSPQGEIQVDEKGKAAGRGAYLCRNKACWDCALAHDRLDHAFRTKLSHEDKARLTQYSQQLPYAEMPSAAEMTIPDPASGNSLAKGEGTAATLES